MDPDEAPRTPAASRYLVPLLVAAFLLGAGWALKEPCVDQPWGGEEYRTGCYSDVLVLYEGRGLDEDALPYRDAAVEYPPLTGLWMHGSALVSDSEAGFFIAHAAVASLLALGTVAILSLARGERSLWFAAAPALALYAFHNWDLLAVALAAGGLLAAQRQRPWAAGLLLGLGAAAKIYPGFLLAGLFVHALGNDRPRALRLAAAGAGGFLLPHLPFLVIAPRGLLEAYTFHLGRGPTFESHWRFLYDFGVPEGTAYAFLALGLLAAWALAWTGRVRPLHAAAASLLVFVLGNPVFSVQYMLWIAGVLPFLDVDWRVKVAVLAVDVWVWNALFDFFHERSRTGAPDETLLMLASLARMVALGALLGSVLRRPRTGPPPAVPAAQGTPGA